MDAILNDIFTIVQNFTVIFFLSMKYIFSSILLILGAYTLISLKFLDEKFRDSKEKVNLDYLKKKKVIIGIVYLSLGMGFLFNFFAIFLYFILPRDGLLSAIIFHLINNGDLLQASSVVMVSDFFTMLFAFLSFIALLSLFLSIWILLHDRQLNNSKSIVSWMISSLILGILFGFSYCLPFLL